MRSIEEINTALLALWARQAFQASQAVYAPMQYRAPRERSVVFVGLNPSFSAKGWKRLLRLSQKADLEPDEIFRWPQPSNCTLEVAHVLEDAARAHYQFFQHHRALARALDCHWEHFDLFAYRESKQSRIRSVVLQSQRGTALNEFGEAQFELFIDVLRLARPSVVIVVNALASQIYKERRCPRVDRASGYYQDSVDPAHEFPVFFSGMLTGPHALDRFSRERLLWQVARVLGKEWPVTEREEP